MKIAKGEALRALMRMRTRMILEVRLMPEIVKEYSGWQMATYLSEENARIVKTERYCDLNKVLPQVKS